MGRSHRVFGFPPTGRTRRAQLALSLGKRELRMAVRASHICLGLSPSPLAPMPAHPRTRLRSHGEVRFVFLGASGEVAREEPPYLHKKQCSGEDRKPSKTRERKGERTRESHDHERQPELVSSMTAVHEARHPCAQVIEETLHCDHPLVGFPHEGCRTQSHGPIARL